MSDSTSPIHDAILVSQGSKETTANANMDATSPALLFGRRQSDSSLLRWAYYGGKMVVDGVLTVIPTGFINLVAGTNYIESTKAGVVSSNLTGFTAGRIPLYTAVATTTVTSWTDWRAWVTPPYLSGRLALSIGTDANATLTAAQARNDILDITSSVSLTATRNIVLPLTPQQWTVYNGTTGAQSLQFIGASGTGITVANGKRAILYADGTNVVRATADV